MEQGDEECERLQVLIDCVEQKISSLQQQLDKFSTQLRKPDKDWTIKEREEFIDKDSIRKKEICYFAQVQENQRHRLLLQNERTEILRILSRYSRSTSASVTEKTSIYNENSELTSIGRGSQVEMRYEANSPGSPLHRKLMDSLLSSFYSEERKMLHKAKSISKSIDLSLEKEMKQLKENNTGKIVLVYISLI